MDNDMVYDDNHLVDNIVSQQQHRGHNLHTSQYGATEGMGNGLLNDGLIEQLHALDDTHLRDQGGGVACKNENSEFLNREDSELNPQLGVTEQQSSQDADDEQPDQDRVPQDEDCAGFDENLVLAVKECFFEDEIRCILIKKAPDGKKVKYYNRSCLGVANKRKVCHICDKWFTNLSAGLPFTENMEKEIENFLEVKMDDNKYSVKVEDAFMVNIKQEEDNLEHDQGDGGEDWLQDDVRELSPKGRRHKALVTIGKGVRRSTRSGSNSKPTVPPELQVSVGFKCRQNGCDVISINPEEWGKHDRSHEESQTCSLCDQKVSNMGEHLRDSHPDESHMDDWPGDVSDHSTSLEIPPEIQPLPKKKGRPKGALNKKNRKGAESADNCDVSDYLSEINSNQKEKKTKTRKDEKTKKYSINRDTRGNYVCWWDKCDLVFEKKKAFKKHVFLVHEGGTQKQKLKKICDICGNLVTANNMRQHVRTVHTHKHVKNYSCEHCGKEFKYRSELTVHLTHHTGEMNFSCTGCAKKFRRAAEARLCEKGHRGIFAFSCHLCDYKTNKKNHLDRHIESHLKATPYTCPVCGFKSGRKDNLKQHVEKRHCSANTTIKQLEEMYPDMYKVHDNSEAVEIAKNEAMSVSKVKNQREEKFSPGTFQSSDNKFMEEPLSSEMDIVPHSLPQNTDISDPLKYQMPEQLEHKYLPPDTHRLNTERYLQFQEQRDRMIGDRERSTVLDQRLDRDRLLQFPNEERDRLASTDRDRIGNPGLASADRLPTTLQVDRDRIQTSLQQADRDRIQTSLQVADRDRIMAEQRAVLLERQLQEHRERFGHVNPNFAEMYQRMRSLDQ